MFKFKHYLTILAISLTLMTGSAVSPGTGAVKTGATTSVSDLVVKVNESRKSSEVKITATSFKETYDENTLLVSRAKLAMRSKAQLPDISGYRLVWEVGLSNVTLKRT